MSGMELRRFYAVGSDSTALSDGGDAVQDRGSASLPCTAARRKADGGRGVFFGSRSSLTSFSSVLFLVAAQIGSAEKSGNNVVC